MLSPHAHGRRLDGELLEQCGGNDGLGLRHEDRSSDGGQHAVVVDADFVSHIVFLSNMEDPAAVQACGV